MGENQVAKVERVLNLVSPLEIKSYVDKYRADFSANKLHTIVFLKLFIYAWMFDRNGLSLRTIATYSTSKAFKEIAKLENSFSVGKSSLSERLASIPWQMFRELFEDLAQRAFATLPNKKESSNKTVNQLLSQAHILDSTIITLSAKLLKDGFEINEGSLSFKASIAICGKQIPIKAFVLTEKTYASEDQALPNLIDFQQKNIIYIFDRGIQRLKTYADITKSGNWFISRLSAKNYTVEHINTLPKNLETETLTIIKDELISFPQLKEKEKSMFRLITGRSKKDNRTIRFITNLTTPEAIDITEVYRYRWSIEVFFRFLKSELHLENLLSYSENGIKVHIYLTLIAFLLTWIYKEQNKIKSFKRAREQLSWFLLDLLMEHRFKEGLQIGVALRELIFDSS